MVNVYSSVPPSQAAEWAVPHLCKQERKRPTKEAAKPVPRCSWQDHSRRVVADVGDESTESHSVLQPLCSPLVLCIKWRLFKAELNFLFER